MISTKILDVQLQSASFTYGLFFQFPNAMIEAKMLKNYQPLEVKHFNMHIRKRSFAIIPNRK